MKKSMSIILMGMMSMQVMAQNDKSKKVSTKFLQIPSYNVSEVNPSDISVEYVSGKPVFGTPALKDSKTMCVPNGGGVKDVIEVTTYYYQVPMTEPEAYLVAKTTEGQFVMAEKIGSGQQTNVDYGKGECRFWIKTSMEKAYATEKAQFQSDQTAKIKNDLQVKASEFATNNIYPSYDYEKLEVHYASGKAFDYSALDKAYEDAMAAYESFSEKGFNTSGYQMLQSSIATWEKEVATVDKDNKKARINKAIAKGIYENLMNAYSYTYQSNKAIRAGKKCLELWGNWSNNSTAALKNKIMQLRAREAAENKNTDLVGDAAKIQDLTSLVGNGSVNLIVHDQSHFERVKAAYMKFGQEQVTSNIEAEKADFEADVASGEANPYDPFVVQSATQGKVLTLNAFSLMASGKEIDGFPDEACNIKDLTAVNCAGLKLTRMSSGIKNWTMVKTMNLSRNSITEIPEEIGEMTSLQKLNLSGNPITSVPESIKNCKNLKKLNLKGSALSKDAQKKLAKLLPDTKISF